MARYSGDAVARAAVNLTRGDGHGVGLTPATHWGHHRDDCPTGPRGRKPTHASPLSEVSAGAEGTRARLAHGRDHGGAGHTGAPLFLLPRLSRGSLPPRRRAGVSGGLLTA